MARCARPTARGVQHLGVAASVGSGTAPSCTESGVPRHRVASRGHLQLRRGTGCASPSRRTIDLPTDRSIVIDGGNKVTLDGGGTTRIFRAVREDYRRNPNTITLQRITLARARPRARATCRPSATNASCAYGWADGQGGAILVRDTRLRAIDATFLNNAAAQPGPDVGRRRDLRHGLPRDDGGSARPSSATAGRTPARWACCRTDGRVYNSVFRNNVASGTGQNFQGVRRAECRRGPARTRAARAGNGGVG
jgi:hypothetical protein